VIRVIGEGEVESAGDGAEKILLTVIERGTGMGYMMEWMGWMEKPSWWIWASAVWSLGSTGRMRISAILEKRG